MKVSERPNVRVAGAGSHLVIDARGGEMPPDLEVHFDAGVDLAVDAGNVVQSWGDQSAHGYDGVRASGAPELAADAIDGLPVVQFRGNDDWLNISDSFFAKDIYMVWRSPSATFSNYGGILGAQSGRGSTFITENNNTTMHSNQYPDAVSRNGVVLSSPYNMAPVDEYMLLKVVVNNDDTGAEPYQIGRVDGYSFDIDVAEIIAFSRQSDLEKKPLEISNSVTP